MYKDYIKERLGRELIETDKGFVTFGTNCLNLPFDHVYIEDIYIKPEYRLTGAGRDFMDAVVDLTKQVGISRIIGSVCVGTNGCDTSLKAAIAYGMKLLSTNNNTIYLYKDIT